LQFLPKQCAMTLIACARACASSFAEEAVRQAPVFAQPFYRSGKAVGDAPIVAVAANYDQLLAASGPAATEQVVRGIQVEPALITP
jgi:hypothetical protein